MKNLFVPFKDLTIPEREALRVAVLLASQLPAVGVDTSERAYVVQAEDAEAFDKARAHEMWLEKYGFDTSQRRY